MNKLQDVLSLTVREALGPGVVALVSQGDMCCQILHTRSMVKLLSRLMDDLESNRYRNREIQDKYNKGLLELRLLDTVSIIETIEAITIKDLILKYAVLIETSRLQSNGYRVIPNGPPVDITAKAVVAGKFKHRTIQVSVTLARGTKYFVQKVFLSLDEARAYLASTDLVQVLIDTKGVILPFKPEIPVIYQFDENLKFDKRQLNTGRPVKRRRKKKSSIVAIENNQDNNNNTNESVNN